MAVGATQSTSGNARVVDARRRQDSGNAAYFRGAVLHVDGDAERLAECHLVQLDQIEEDVIGHFGREFVNWRRSIDGQDGTALVNRRT